MRKYIHGCGPVPDHRWRAPDHRWPRDSLRREVLRAGKAARRHRCAPDELHVLLPGNDEYYSQCDSDSGDVAVQPPRMRLMEYADLIHRPVNKDGLSVDIPARHRAPGAAVIR